MLVSVLLVLSDPLDDITDKELESQLYRVYYTSVATHSLCTFFLTTQNFERIGRVRASQIAITALLFVNIYLILILSLIHI